MNAMKNSRNLWPFGVILAFVLFAGGTAGLIVYASTQKVELVSDNYYEQEIRYQSRIDSVARTRQLGSQASVVYDSASGRATVSVPAEHVKAKAAGSIQLYRPSATGLDRQIQLNPDTNGLQVLDLSDLSKGLWKIYVAWTVADAEYYLDEKFVAGTNAKDQ